MFNNNNEFKFSNILRFLIILSAIQPYIGIPILFKSDIQPTCLFLCLVYLVSSTQFKITKNQYLLSILLIIPAGISFLQAFIFDNSNLSEIARRLFPLFGAPIYFITFSSIFRESNRVKAIEKAINYFIIIFFTGFFLNLFTQDSITSLFISRGIYESFGARGFTSFFPEPSRIPEQCFFAFYLYFFSRNYINSNPLLLGLIALLAKSGQSIVMSASLIPFFFTNLLPLKTLIKKYIKIKQLLIILVFPFISIFIVRFMASSRGGAAVSDLFSIGKTYLATDLGVLTKMTGVMLLLARIITLDFEIISPVKPWEAVSNNPALSESYQSICTFLTSITNCPITYSVYSGLGSYIIYYGIFGMFLFALLFGLAMFSIIKKFEKKERIQYSSLLLAFLINSVIKIPLANPSLIMIICLFLAPKINLVLEKQSKMLSTKKLT